MNNLDPIIEIAARICSALEKIADSMQQNQQRTHSFRPRENSESYRQSGDSAPVRTERSFGPRSFGDRPRGGAGEFRKPRSFGGGSGGDRRPRTFRKEM